MDLFDEMDRTPGCEYLSVDIDPKRSCPKYQDCINADRDICETDPKLGYPFTLDMHKLT